MPQHHVSRSRGADVALRSGLAQGRFGRLFRHLPPFEPEDDALIALSERMREPAETPSGGWQPSGSDLDSDIPAGYTYLGQFVDHDITFDPASSLQRQVDPEGLRNFRTPRFDLDSLYGAGPNNDPFMYDPALDGGRTALLLGSNENGEPDLPRNGLPPNADGEPQGRALIGDPRNDENIIVGQLHLLFLKFHNKVLGDVRGKRPSLSGDHLFEEAQRVARWHYQWIVVHDFLPRVVGEKTVEDIFDPLGRSFYAEGLPDKVKSPRFDLKFYPVGREPFMPVEFSVAAYRFGHSMLRPSYKINNTVPLLPLFAPDAGRFGAFHGFRPLPPQWTIDWSFFFESSDQANMQVARKIDARLSEPTFTIPGLDPGELALRNLRRGKALGLPSGQRVARAMGITPMTSDQLGIADLSPDFADDAPLWFYILKEAEVLGGGKLGPVGGRIVAEVLLGLLKADPLSYINLEPHWTPTLGDNFRMPDLIAFVA